MARPPRAAAARRSQRLGAHQRHVTVQHQHLRAARHLGQRLRQRMARAELLFLLHPLEVRAVERRTHLGTAMTVHHQDLLRLKRSRGVEHVREERPARQLVQHLGQCRMHALSLPGGEHDDCEAHGAGF